MESLRETKVLQNVNKVISGPTPFNMLLCLLLAFLSARPPFTRFIINRLLKDT